MKDGHALRWARRKIRNEYDYSKWHYTTDAFTTLCNKIIPIALQYGTFFPETDDIDCVDCKKCLQKINIYTLRYN